jgi:hypothetical protein
VEIRAAADRSTAMAWGRHLALSGYLRGLLPRQLAGASFAAIFVAMRVAGGLVLGESGHFLSDVRS